MKRFLLIISILACGYCVNAQPYNNEWIDYSKTYYKFKVATSGLYHIKQSILATIPQLATANAQDFQLWRNGLQVPMFTSVATGPLGTSDYLEFWGEMNDGLPDTALYDTHDFQLNDALSMETDTASFFLTVNPGGANLRLVSTPNNLAANTLLPEPYFMRRSVFSFRQQVNPGRAELVGDSYTYCSSYDAGEGITSLDLANGATISYAEANLRPYLGAGAPGASVQVNAAGNAVNPRNFRVKLNGVEIATAPLDFYDVSKLNTPVTSAALNASNTLIEVTNMCDSANDRMVVSKIEIKYPRIFDFGGASISYVFDLPANVNGNYLEISNFINTALVPPIIFDLTNGKKYYGDISNPSLIKVALEPSSVDRKLVIVNPTIVSNVTSIAQRNFIDYSQSANQGDFLIISNTALTQGATGNPINDYRDYRASAAGGGYNAKVYMYDQLEDQFGLGIKKHPLSVRNFIRWARATFAAPVQDVLIIGKGVVYNQHLLNITDPNMDKLDLVPTFGFPASDNLLTAVRGSSIPLTPIGRISAITPDEVSVYLTKLKEYEQTVPLSSPLIADKAWMKKVVHVIGGSDDVTTGLLLDALDRHKLVIQDTLYGGSVETFVKSSADAVEQISSSRLTEIFNSGLGLLTYFGHSSSSSLEFNLDNPNNYSNQGKYPIFIVMGCNAGSFYNFNVARFTTKETLSEKYVLAPERGSIAFLASTYLGIVHYLDIYNTQTYTAASVTKYGRTIGEIMGEAIRKVFDQTSQDDFYAKFQCEQFSLHGDPALKLYNFAKPDYVIEDPLVKVSPSFISVAETQFKVNAQFMNIGRAVNTPIVIQMKRTYPSGITEVVRRDTIPGVRYIDSLTYTLPVVASRDKGLNRITITLDADNAVDELYETNNSITKDVYIYEDEARPVYPYEFSIVSNQDVKLQVSSANAFAEMRTYTVQIDTSELFTSISKVTRTLSSTGGVFEFTPGITFADSTVYYWRVAPNPPTGDTVWNTTSFEFIQNSQPGFAQAHYYQHLKSDQQRVFLQPDRQWHYGDISNQLVVKTGVWATAISQEAENVVNVNDESFIRNTCGFVFAYNVFDKNTFVPWKNQATGSGGLYGSNDPTCFDSRIWNFEYNDNATGRTNAMNFLRQVPDGDYVTVRFITLGGSVYQYVNDWKNDEIANGAGNSMYTELKNQGFTLIDSVNRQRAFIFVFKKNGQALHPPQQVLSDGIYDAITLTAYCETPDSLGFITSPQVGPAKAWKQLHWRGSSLDTPTVTDAPTVSLYGVSTTGAETLVASNLGTSAQDYDISSIDAALYPYMKMKMTNLDSVHFSPYQLRYWMLTYDPVPEGAIAPNIYYSGKDTVEVGEPVTFGVAFKNVSKVDFDSVKVKFTITDKNNIQTIVPIPRQKKLVIGDTIKINVPVDTRPFSGHNTVFMNFNPDDDQPEQYLFNNFGFKDLYVRPDSLNPLLDVTFDNVHILNRDIVSSKPTIIIKLKDEAKWLVLNDTSLLTVKVRYPDGSLKQYYFNNNSDTLQFTPAGPPPNSDNTASINFMPYFPLDGEYELVVTGKDASNNSAGNIEYHVAFEVINKPMISNMLNYPNPFTTSTAFVFTITGSEVPQNIRIQILTITGKIVRDITKEELGPLRIGRNMTEFKWDGTDQYGAKLANGIYLYRVITNLNGKSLDKYKAEGDNTDKFFNKGYGKMYLMR